jgi:response regulator RpfG family c-di-GMP phosphodiesterase
MPQAGKLTIAAGSAPILVVDDDANVRRAVSRALAATGHEVVEADSVDAALSALERFGGVPLVVSDIHMPGRDGLALLKEVRARYPDTAVIMLTGDADVSTAVACLKTGAVDYLPKPVLVEEVRARVSRALEQRQTTLELQRLREAYQRDLESQVRELSRKNQEMFLAQVQMAVRMLEAKDPYTRGHSGRVAQYAVATARRMGLDPAFIEQVRMGGELHDIGKIGTRDAILNKPGRLTPEEFAEVRRHTTDGEAMLEVLRADRPEVLAIVRWHHEHMDGTGFPDGLKGVAIPLSARIVSVADAFDAMTSTRTYHEMSDADFALAELERHRGTQFDADVVTAFVQVFPEVAVLLPRH